ncbi:hypothetical protein [Bartonella harrusi]|uniref:Uncharacterized protein n=1 Tax=Bartonella harrusi TaxID=2961895 RepID=A0ABY5ETP4_9HYPH|nr:hypothetical protein [Bartonella harrusi]UTO28786.1 hypothetical protein NMK50_01875 [Bartonella harrusi]
MVGKTGTGIAMFILNVIIIGAVIEVIELHISKSFVYKVIAFIFFVDNVVQQSLSGMDLVMGY